MQILGLVPVAGVLCNSVIGFASTRITLFKLSRRPRARLYRRMDYRRTRTEDNKSLVEMLESSGRIESKRIRDVMELLDRGLFVPEGNEPYSDNPVSIGYNATISAPHMHATCLQLLDEHLQPGKHALDVGSGTGYLTAAFALLVRDQGRAVGVEHITELVQQALLNVTRSKASHLLSTGCLTMHVGDGRQGWLEHAPYNAIHVGAASKVVPQALIDQLDVGGRMVIPVGDNFLQVLKVIDKHFDGSVEERSITFVRYVPLTNKDAQVSDDW